jgi:hypothetical protein
MLQVLQCRAHARMKCRRNVTDCQKFQSKSSMLVEKIKKPVEGGCRMGSEISRESHWHVLRWSSAHAKNMAIQPVVATMTEVR